MGVFCIRSLNSAEKIEHALWESAGVFPNSRLSTQTHTRTQTPFFPAFLSLIGHFLSHEPNHHRGLYIGVHKLDKMDCVHTFMQWPVVFFLSLLSESSGEVQEMALHNHRAFTESFFPEAGHEKESRGCVNGFFSSCTVYFPSVILWDTGKQTKHPLANTHTGSRSRQSRGALTMYLLREVHSLPLWYGGRSEPRRFFPGVMTQRPLMRMTDGSPRLHPVLILVCWALGGRATPASSVSKSYWTKTCL